ncbi:phage tail tape measure protein [Curtobacterium sp. DN_7.5]|uniref:phage tail tape measure protein n=1 Tax=Curtobacterium sp. DN_7.5 TaxID=3049047 RepID=UPI001F58FE11|nr:phage tail tape measure protein [Curtobacterium sp. DN_7.5]
MAFGSDRSVKLTVAATMDGFVNELDRGTRAGQQWSRSIAANAKQAAVALHSVKDEAKEVAVPLLAIGTVAAAGVAYAVKSYADFDEKMSSVKSLSHATAEEQQKLKQAALETGTAIGYSATQAADAEIELVKAGVSANDIYGGALAGSLKLAAAGQIDVADATSIAASTLTQFNLKGKDVTHVADLLAAGADKALGGVSDLGEGLKYIGPVAASSNVSLEQTVGSLALLAQNGILGEQAGTSLRGMLLSLTAPSELAAKTMQRYGIEVYDAQGKFIGFNGVAQQLHDRLGTLDDAQRDAALGTIFGNAQITAATILMKDGASAVDKWTAAVNEQGFATEQALGKMNNLNGDLTKLKASFQTAAIVTGEAANGPLRGAVQVVTDLIDSYNRAPGAVQGVVLGVGALTAAVALTGGTALIAVPKIVAFGVALQTLSQSQIPGVSRAAGLGIKAASGLAKGFGAVSNVLLGPFGLALAAGALALHTLDLAADSGRVSQEKLTNAISTSASAVDLLAMAGKRTDLSKLVAGDTEKRLQNLKAVIGELKNEQVGLFSSFGIKEESKAVTDLGSALAQVGSADAPAAARAFKSLKEQQRLTRAETLQLLDLMPDYKAELTNQATALGISASKSNLLKLATGDYKSAAESAKNPTKENADALQQMDKSAEDAAKAIQDTSNALKGLTSPTLDAREAERQFQAAIDAVTQSIKDNKETYKDAGTSLDIHTEEGRKNQAALDGIAQSAENAASALYTQTGSQDKATAALQAGRDELMKALGQYGITGAAAQAYADKIIGTPKDWATLFSNNAAAAGGPVDGLNGKIRAIPTGYNSTINVNVSGAANVEATKNAIDRLKAAIQQAAAVGAATPIVAHASGGNVAFAGGGAVYGPGTGTSDSIAARLSNGEHIVTAAEVRALGGQAAMYELRAAIRSNAAGQMTKRQLVEAVRSVSTSGVPGFANGGAVVTGQYAPPPAQRIVVQAGGGGGDVFAPTFVSSGSQSADLDRTMFVYRTQVRGRRRR